MINKFQISITQPRQARTKKVGSQNRNYHKIKNSKIFVLVLFYIVLIWNLSIIVSNAKYDEISL